VTVHAIRIAGDPVLHQPTREITQFDDELRTLVEDMFETMYAAEGVNPKLETSEIPETMPDPDDDWEGCLSAPGESYPTGRATWAKVTGFDVDGNPIEVEGTGYFARCLQHETDHLDGYLYLDRLVGRYARAAKKMLKKNKWGVPGLSWTPPREPADA
jgi:peptide deformylase